MGTEHDNRFANLNFTEFGRLAKNPTLNQYEKIGFPTVYREGKEEAIFEDILRKLPNLAKPNQTVLDIGPGCSGLARMMIDFCRGQRHKLVLVDSPEMLGLLPDAPFVTKVAGRYPGDCPALFEAYSCRFDAILCYSVLHYVFVEGNLFEFLDRTLTLISDGGEALLGDLPNVSKRKRFFSSQNGIAFHKAFMNTENTPDVHFGVVEPGAIDDGVILGIIMRSRSAGFDAYWLPQPSGLPMANRREDVLIRKP